jgi:predicted nuclease with RNAse H fold
MIYAGIDVGGRSKGFHAAALDDEKLVGGPRQLPEVDAVLSWLDKIGPKVIAIDSPKTCAAPGETSRAGERALMKEICGIRFTPEETKLDANPYYEWIVRGRELYAALEQGRGHRGASVIEVFPTASWTVWAGPRGTKTRARWSSEALEAMNLPGIPARRLNQDDRDAVAAALTARLYRQGRSRAFGEIVVPPGD